MSSEGPDRAQVIEELELALRKTTGQSVLHSQAVARLRANVFGEGAPAPAKRRGRPPRAKG